MASSSSSASLLQQRSPLHSRTASGSSINHHHHQTGVRISSDNHSFTSDHTLDEAFADADSDNKGHGSTCDACRHAGRRPHAPAGYAGKCAGGDTLWMRMWHARHVMAFAVTVAALALMTINVWLVANSRFGQPDPSVSPQAAMAPDASHYRLSTNDVSLASPPSILDPISVAIKSVFMRIAVAGPSAASPLASSSLPPGRLAHAAVVCNADDVDRALVYWAGLVDTRSTAPLLLFAPPDLTDTLESLLDGMRAEQPAPVPSTPPASESILVARALNSAKAAVVLVEMPITPDDDDLAFEAMEGYVDTEEGDDDALAVHARDSPPPASNATRKAEAERISRAACIHNALVHAWNVTAYSRIALANPSIMVPVQQPDTVFLLPHLSGTRDERDDLDGGLLVFAPDASIATALAARFAKTPAAANPRTDTLTRALAVLQATIAQSLAKGKTAGSHNGPFTAPSRLVPPIALYASDPDVRSSAALVRLSPSVNPWTVLTAGDASWQQHADMSVFGVWTSRHHQISQHVRLASDNDLGSLGLGNIDGGDDKVKRKMEQWAYSNRSNLVCRPFMASMHKLSVARQQPASAFRSNLVTDRFSVLMSTFNRIETVRRLIKYYRRSPLVDALFLTWHNPHAEPPQALLDLADAVVVDNASEVDWDAIAQSRAAKADQKQQGSDAYLATVIIVRQQTDTLNNRFNPIAGIRTPSVLMIDDDIRIPMKYLQVGFDAWLAHTDRLVGFFPRTHEVTDTHNTSDSTRWDYKYHYGPIAAHRDYSMMLTKGMFLGTDLLFAYTCLLPPRVHAYIDAIKNCEDIAMNFVASGLAGTSPMAVDFPAVHGETVGEPDKEALVMADFGRDDGISVKTGHKVHRSNCLRDLAVLLGKMPLVSSQINIQEYRGNAPFRFRELEAWPEDDHVVAYSPPSPTPSPPPSMPSA